MSLDMGDAYRPALAPLRGSTGFAVFGLAAIAIAGCSVPSEPDILCVEGVTYLRSSGSYRAAITLAVDHDGKPLPCEENAQ